MKRFKNPLKNFFYMIYRWILPYFNPSHFFTAFFRYFRYFGNWIKYKSIKGSEKIRWIDTYPSLHDRTATTSFDAHYFHQGIWAFNKIKKSASPEHVDVGSQISYVGFLTSVTKVTFVDIRPLEAQLENYRSQPGSILEMPYKDNSIPSLSSLHVAEHIGLGRYGDPIDPKGSYKACRELARVLAKGGNLYFSLPVGKPRVCFNSHRIHSPSQILEYFNDLKLIELSGITDEGKFVENIDRAVLENSDYACGLFHFSK